MKPRAPSLALLALLLAAVGCDGPREETAEASPAAPPSSATRTLVLAVDALGFPELLPLLREGRLPHLASLMARGYSARLSTQVPAHSPVVWTTIATGRHPEMHGVRSFAEAGPEGRPVPATSGLRRTRTVWDILGTEGNRRVGVVGWWVTWPAEPVNGALVSSYAGLAGGFFKGRLPAELPRATWPPELVEELRPLMEEEAGKGDDLLRREIAPEVGDPATLPAYLGKMLEDSESVYLTDRIFQRAGELVDERHAPDWLTVYLAGIDVVEHRFWKFSFPEHYTVYRPAEEEIERLGGIIPGYHEYVDRCLGSWLERFGERARVFVVSDHGMAAVHGKIVAEGNSAAHEKRVPDGVLIAAGPGIASNFDPGWQRAEDLPRLGDEGHPAVLDLTPTWLHLEGLPVGEDLDGRVLEEILAGEPAARPVTLTASYEGLAASMGPGSEESVIDEALLERLRSLGYID